MYFLGNKYYREGRLYVNVYIYSWLKVKHLHTMLHLYVLTLHWNTTF